MNTVRPKNIAPFIDGTWDMASGRNLTNARKRFDCGIIFSI